MRTGEVRGEIKALTGLRIVAAVWVVLFHFRPMLADVSPDFRDALAPVLNCGAQGVDLFFILTGFVLISAFGTRSIVAAVAITLAVLGILSNPVWAAALGRSGARAEQGSAGD